jgi:uncharacterized protein YheU (UPF0270 family)
MTDLSAESLDRLVELHVLSENGDGGAAAEAAHWITGDPEARRVWDTVERNCELLRSEPGTT